VRVARVRLHPQRSFGALGVVEHGWFGVEARARCTFNGALPPEQHDWVSPDPTCSCGFYSYALQATIPPEYLSPFLVYLDVELAGRVIVHELGYRSQWQRVLGVRVPACYCGGRRDRVQQLGSGELAFSCGQCGTGLLPGRFLVSERYRPWGPRLELGLLETLLPVGVEFEAGGGSGAG
jgi:hypothetical protein